MFVTARRFPKPEEALPGVGDYSLRSESLNRGPIIKGSWSASKRPPLNPPPNGIPAQYVSHKPLHNPNKGIKWNNGARFKPPPEDIPAVGTYDLTKINAAIDIQPPRPTRTTVWEQQDAQLPLSLQYKVPLPPSIPSNDTAGYGTDALTGKLVPIPKMVESLPPLNMGTSLRKNNAIAFNQTPRWDNTVEEGRGPGAYELNLPDYSTKKGVSFAAGKGGVGAMGRPTTAPHVGPGSYHNNHYHTLFRPSHILPPEKQNFGSGGPRDPLDLDRIAKIDNRPGVGSYTLTGINDVSRKAKNARIIDKRYIQIGQQRAQSAFIRTQAPSVRLFGGITDVSGAFTTKNGATHGVTPRPGNDELPPPKAPVPIGIPIPAFGKTALRHTFELSNKDLPGPMDYITNPPPSERRVAARAASAGTGFSTSRRFVPSERDMQLLSNPAATDYDPFDIPSHSYPGRPFGGSGLPSSRSPSPRHAESMHTTTTDENNDPVNNRRTQASNANYEEQPLGEWNFTANLRLPTAKPTFNTVAQKGDLMAIGGIRSSLVTKDMEMFPGPADYTPRSPRR